MKVCVFGAGAIGGHLAGRLAQGGAEVSVVARGAHLAAMQAQGLRIEGADESFTVAVRASADPAALGPQDAVLVTVKSPALPSVAAAIAPLLRADTPVVFVINGIPWWYSDGLTGELAGSGLPALDPGGALRHAVGTARTVGGVVHSSCEVVAPGVIHLDSRRNRLVLGEPNGPVSARLEAIAAPLRAGGLTVDLSSDIRTSVWAKLIMNLAGSAMATLTQSAPCHSLAEPAVEAAFRAIYAEGLAIARAVGCDPVIDIEASIRSGRSSAHRSSMLQDLVLGRPMEVATILEAPLALARLARVATPTLDLIVALARLRAKAAGLAGQ